MAPTPTKREIFDQVVPPDEQARFGAGETLFDDGPIPSISAYDSRVSDFHDRDVDGEVFRAIATYIHTVIPKPRATYAADLWSISCLPSTNSGARLFTLNCPGVEALFGGVDNDGEFEWDWIRINLSLQALPEDRWPALREAHGLTEDSLKIEDYAYPAVCLVFPAERTEEILADTEIRAAARAFVQERMTRGGTTYRHFASQCFAKELLGEPLAEVMSTGTASSTDRPPPPPTPPVNGQGREQDPITRKAVEDRAMSVAAELLAAAGYEARDVHTENLGYDIEGRRGEAILHVEVKGTRGSRAEVTVTRGEVNHAIDIGSVLIVVSEIGVDGSIGHGGKAKVWQPWLPSNDSLIPTEYRHDLDLSGSADAFI